VSIEQEKFTKPYTAAERGFVDDVIEPSQTRYKLITGFALLRTKVDSNPKKKHGNIPL
jgi:propionyl-CoA carboxylase beta chain